MRLAWLTDIHLNFINSIRRKAYYELVKSHSADALVISGDIGEGNSFIEYLCELEAALQIPIYFVLGNHDFYRSSFERSERDASAVCRELSRLCFLDQSQPISLGGSTVLLGHSSWYDVRLGVGENFSAQMADFRLIRNLVELSHEERVVLFQERAQRATSFLALQLKEAFELGDHILLATHVPPFQAAVLAEGRLSNDEYLPLYSCKVLGELLTQIMSQSPQKSLTVLCGHTHNQAEVQVLPNLKVRVGAAIYEQPAVQDVFVIPG